MKIGQNKNKKWYIKDKEKIILEISASKINSLIKALKTINETIEIERKIANLKINWREEPK